MTPGSLSPRVSLVVPVRDPSSAKSRLVAPGSRVSEEQRERLAAAIALDTVESARAATLVGELVVVGALREPLPGVRVIPDPGAGLIAAIGEGLDVVDPRQATARAVLLGDLPAMNAADLDAAFSAALDTGYSGNQGAGEGENMLRAADDAWSRALSFVADAQGSGTTLVIAAPGEPHMLRFGPHSAQLHRAAGYRELSLAPDSALNRDVDTLDELLELRRLHHLGALTLGARTRAALDAV